MTGAALTLASCVRKGFAADVLGIVRTPMRPGTPSGRRGMGRGHDDSGPVYLARNALFSRLPELDLRVTRPDDLQPQSLQVRTTRGVSYCLRIIARVGDPSPSSQERRGLRGKLPIVFGDLNVDDNHLQREQSLAPLMLLACRIVCRLAATRRWTHYYVVGQDVASRLHPATRLQRASRTSSPRHHAQVSTA